MDDNESMVHTRAKRALHYFVTTLILITVAVTSIIVAIWPQKQGIRSTLCDGKGAIPCRYVLTFFGDWEKFVEPDGHDHALVRSWSRTYRSLSRKHRAIVTGARTLLAAHAATPSQTFMLGEAWCEAHLQSFAPPLNTSLWRWFHNAKTSAPRRSELCRLGFLYARGGFYMDMDLQPLYTGALHRHMHHWAGFVTVIAQGWAGLNATRGRKNRLSLRGSILGATPHHPLILAAATVLAGVLDRVGPHARACAGVNPNDSGALYGCALARALEATYPHVYKRMHEPPPVFEFQKERLQFLQEARPDEAGLAHVAPPGRAYPCASPACRFVLTMPPSREPVFFSRPND